jgi:uncharacterized protein with HEPN domain
MHCGNEMLSVELIGKATKNLSDDVRTKMPDIEWKKIAGMRGSGSASLVGQDSNLVILYCNVLIND